MSSANLPSCAIIVAGGSGTRAGSPSHLPKQLQPLLGKMIIAWSIEAFAKDSRFGPIIVVCPPDLQRPIQEGAGDIDVIFANSGATRT
ncbi:MAG: NTP transferase domain-containing protein, partial [Hyphomonadaceae bacterium]|nr:NTP transferase domain-containing protein [Hyphomonadaceae bacterium]